MSAYFLLMGLVCANSFAERNKPLVLDNDHASGSKRVSHEPIAKRLYDCRAKMIEAGMENDLRELDSDGSFYFVPSFRLNKSEDPIFVVRKQGNKFSVLEGDRIKLGEHKQAVLKGPDKFRVLAGSVAHRGEDITVLRKACDGEQFPKLPEMELKATKLTKPDVTRIETLGVSYTLGAIEHALGAATFGAEQGAKRWIDYLKAHAGKFTDALDFCHDRLASVDSIGTELDTKINRYQQIMRSAANGTLKPADPSSGVVDPSVVNPGQP